MPDDVQVPETPEVLAQNFYAQARRLQRRSNAVLAFIILALIIGAVSVLYLPPVIANIDRQMADFSLEDEVRSLEESQLRILDELTATRDKILAFGADVLPVLQSEVGAWRHEAWTHSGMLNAVTVDDSGRLIAVGANDAWGNGDIVVVTRDENGAWSSETPMVSGLPIWGDLNAVVAAPDGRIVAVGYRYEDGETWPLVLELGKDGVWVPYWPQDAAGRFSGELLSVVAGPSGQLIAIGHEWTSSLSDAVQSNRVLTVTSEPDGTWTVDRPQQEGQDISGQLWSVATEPDGGLVAVGIVIDEWGNEGPLVMTRQPGQDWDVAWPKPESEEIYGRLYFVATGSGSRFVAVGYEEPWFESDNDTVLAIFGDNQGNLTVERPSIDDVQIEGRLNAVTVAPDGKLIAVGGSSGFADGNLLVLEGDSDGNWRHHYLSNAGQPLLGTFNNLAWDPNGGLVGLGLDYTSLEDQHLLVRSSPIGTGVDQQIVAEQIVADPQTDAGRAAIAKHASMILSHVSQEGLLLPHTIAGGISTLREDLSKWESLVDSHISLEGTVTKVESALSEADQWHRAGRIATRIAIVALLIYLVQIAVHLYRYNSRLATYYQARGDAIALIRADAAGKPMGLGDVTLPDIVAALSPDNVAFDKASPPTQQVVDIAKSSIAKSSSS